MRHAPRGTAAGTRPLRGATRADARHRGDRRADEPSAARSVCRPHRRRAAAPPGPRDPRRRAPARRCDRWVGLVAVAGTRTGTRTAWRGDRRAGRRRRHHRRPAGRPHRDRPADRHRHPRERRPRPAGRVLRRRGLAPAGRSPARGLAGQAVPRPRAARHVRPPPGLRPPPRRRAVRQPRHGRRWLRRGARLPAQHGAPRRVRPGRAHRTGDRRGAVVGVRQRRCPPRRVPRLRRCAQGCPDRGEG
jgi:hypothetical protein